MNVLLQSPINGIIPKDINYGGKKIINNGKIMPQMQLKSTNPRLHAYT